MKPLLVAPAMVEGITLLTADELLAQYPGPITIAITYPRNKSDYLVGNEATAQQFEHTADQRIAESKEHAAQLKAVLEKAGKRFAAPTKFAT